MHREHAGAQTDVSSESRPRQLQALVRRQAHTHVVRVEKSKEFGVISSQVPELFHRRPAGPMRIGIDGEEYHATFWCHLHIVAPFLEDTRIGGSDDRVTNLDRQKVEMA